MTDAMTERLESMLFQEYPEIVEYVEKLLHTRITHKIGQLEQLWGMSGEELQAIVNELIRIGFFSRKPGRRDVYEVSPIYHPALGLRTTAGIASRPRVNSDSSAGNKVA